MKILFCGYKDSVIIDFMRSKGHIVESVGTGWMFRCGSWKRSIHKNKFRKMNKLIFLLLILPSTIHAQYDEWPLEPIDSLWKQHEIIVDNYQQSMFEDLIWVKYKIACYQDSVKIGPYRLDINLWQEPNITEVSDTITVHRVPDSYGFQQYKLKVLMEYLARPASLTEWEWIKKTIWKP